MAGDCCELTAANAHAVQYDLRVSGSYGANGGNVWAMTEADRSSTCLLLPDDY